MANKNTEQHYYEFAISLEVSAGSLQEAEELFNEGEFYPLNSGFLLISSDPDTYSWLDERCKPVDESRVHTETLSAEQLLTLPHTLDFDSWEVCSYAKQPDTDFSDTDIFYQKRVGALVMSVRKHINGSWWGAYGVSKNPFLFTSGQLYDDPKLAMNDVKLEVHSFLKSTVKAFYDT